MDLYSLKSTRLITILTIIRPFIALVLLVLFPFLKLLLVFNLGFNKDLLKEPLVALLNGALYPYKASYCFNCF
jgi:hypothetical protein